jgi:hypothetical protein
MHRLLAPVAAVLVLLAGANASAQDTNTLAKAIELLHNGSYERAAPMFFDVSENSGQQELQFRAEYFLALSLYKMGLFHSALYYDSLILEEGVNHPYYNKAVENMVDVMDAIGDKSIIPPILDHYCCDSYGKVDKAVVDRINFIVALWSHKQLRAEDSKQFLDAVKPDSAVYPRALYLLGVQAAQQAKAGNSKLNNTAAALFEKVRKLKSTDKVTYADLADLQNLSTLGLARIRYAQEKFGESWTLYNEIPRFSKQWRDALFEGAYAAFMNKDDGHALGALHTLHSPVAGDQFVPESWLLKGLIYYYECLFDESRASLAHLQDAYSKTTKDEIKAITDAKPRHDPVFFYNLLVKGEQDGVKMPASVRNEILTDDNITSRRSYVNALNTEAKALKDIESWKTTTLRKALLQAVDQQRAKLIQVAGKAIDITLRKLELNLEDFDGQAEIVKLEMTDREKNLLEAGYDPEPLLAKQRLERPLLPNSGVEYWGFDGEYWPDELGHYQYTLKNACPAEAAADATPPAQ